MKISITWRSVSVALNQLLPELEVLIFKPFSDQFNFEAKEEDNYWHSMTFEVSHIMTAMCVSDQVLALLREKDAQDAIRTFAGEQASELNYLLSQLDAVEDATREAILSIRKTRPPFDIVPYLGKRLKGILLLLERRIAYRRSGLPL